MSVVVVVVWLLLVVGCWLIMVIAYWLFVIRCAMLAVRCLLLVCRCLCWCGVEILVEKLRPSTNSACARTFVLNDAGMRTT